MNTLGIFILIIVGICIWRGYEQGLFRSVLIVAATILAMVLSAYTSPHVSSLLQEHTRLDETVETYIITQLELDITQEDSTKNEQMLLIEALPCPDALKLAVINNNNADVYEGLNVQGFQEYLAHYLSCIVMNSLAFIVIQIVITLGLFILLRISKVLTEVPIIHGIDKAGGIVLGLVQALAIIWTLFVLISLIGNSSLGVTAFEQINESPILNFLFEHNLFLNKITDITNVIFA